MTEKQLRSYRAMIHDKIMYIINSDTAIQKLSKKEQLKFRTRIYTYLIEEQALFIEQLFKILKH